MSFSECLGILVGIVGVLYLIVAAIGFPIVLKESVDERAYIKRLHAENNERAQIDSRSLHIAWQKNKHLEHVLKNNKIEFNYDHLI